MRRGTGMDLRTASLVIYLFFLAIFCSLFWRLANKSNPPLATRIALTVSLAIFLHLSFDAPRTSELVWLCASILILITLQSYKWGKILSLTTIAILASVSLLAYEGSIFFQLPLLAATIIGRGEFAKQPVKACKTMSVYLISSSATLILLHIFGGYEAGSLALKEQLAALSPTASETLSEVLTNNLVQTNFDRQLGSSYNWLINSPILIGYFIGFILTVFKELKRTLSFYRSTIIISSLIASISICAIGLDYSRYTALTITMVTLAMLAIKEENSWQPKTTWLFLAAFGCMGPIGVGAINPFPLIKILLGKII